MTEDSALIEQRDALKRRLAAGEYKTALDAVFEAAGRLVQRAARSPRPPPVLYIGLVLALCLLALGLAGTAFFRPADPLLPETVLLDCVSIGITLVSVMAVKFYIAASFATLGDSLTDAIGSAGDVADLGRWLASVCNVRRSLIFIAVYTLLVAVYANVATYLGAGRFMRIDVAIFVALTSIPNGMLLYVMFHYLILPFRFSRYQFDLYGADPASSQVIHRLSGMLTNFVYVLSVLDAIITLYFALTGELTSALLILLVITGWGPIIVLFSAQHYALANIITRAKWKTLNDIQSKIERLQRQEDIPDEKTLAYLGKLMDYHDRIRATRNSALDLRAGLSLVNSLLLPLFAFVVSNLSTIIAFFKR